MNINNNNLTIVVTMVDTNMVEESISFSIVERSNNGTDESAA